MAYAPYYPSGWKNRPDLTTPIRAEALDTIDAGITTAQTTADAAVAAAASKPSIGLLIALGS